MTKRRKKLLSLISLAVLMAVCALSVISCGKTEQNVPEETIPLTAEQSAKEVTVTLEVTDDKGEKTSKAVTTSKTTLREALEENLDIEGEDGEFGLYIKKVNGITADYDENGAYWALYKDGEYLTCSADDEILTDGAVYGLVYTK